MKLHLYVIDLKKSRDKFDIEVLPRYRLLTVSKDGEEIFSA